MIDVSGLDRVLLVDDSKRVTVVEPNVPMDDLLVATLKNGFLPQVVTEFPGITVGGGIQGGAGESSSFKYGFLSQTANWFEMILADGSLVKASPNENSDLFYGSAGSCGTLGVITAAELRLIPAAKFVELTYLPVQSFKAAITVLHTESQKHWDYLDGIMFGPNHGVIVAGKLTNNVTGRVRRFSRAWDPWFYLHAQKIDTAGQVVTEVVPVKDYLFRYDRGAFWVGQYAFARGKVPFNAVTRFLLDPLLHTRRLYQALQDSAASQEYITQDLTFPLDKAEPFLKILDQSLSVYPLWLCPIKPEPRSRLLCNGLDTPLAINIGVWVPQMKNYEEFLVANRMLEREVANLDGKKWMYAHVYYPEKEFWRIYDKNWYDQLREKYHASMLPSFYDKVKVNDRFEVKAKRGLIRTMLGRAKLRIDD